MQKCIMLRFPFIRVLLKPIDTEIDLERNSSNAILNRTKIIDHKYKEVRIGAMEVQICFMLKSEKISKVFLIHSKLESGMWPSISQVLNNIVPFLPRFDIEVKLYDKEVELTTEENNKNDMKGLLKTKVQGINIILYKHKNQEIEELSTKMKIELDLVNDPKKRKEMIVIKRKLEILDKGTNNKNLRSSFTNTFMVHNSNGNFEGGRSITSAKPNNLTKSNFMSNRTFQMFNPENSNEIKDKDAISHQKGEKLISLFTNEEGVVIFKGIPLDAFLIEALESPNFQTKGIVINFKQIPEENLVKKYIGLFPQPNSFIRVNVTQTKMNNNIEEVIHLSNAEVIIHNLTGSEEEKLLFEEQESKVKLVENSELKRYEAIVVPGKYNLEINFKGLDINKKQIQVNPGENVITVNMLSEKKYILKINVLNYEKFVPMENVLVKLKLGKEENKIESITDNNGVSQFEISMKEDFISVFAEKLGFFPCQRTYVRDVNSSGEKEEEIKTRELVVVMVKESFVLKENCVVMITYSNLIGDNFEPVYLYSNNIGNYTDINCGDSQCDNGILTSYFKYHSPTSNERDQLHENEEELEEIIRLVLKLKSSKLKKEFKFNKNLTMNGLQRFSCESLLYTPNNIFYINSPSFSRDQNYDYWDMGFLDVKNILFYEISNLNINIQDKNYLFFDWANLLQILIDTKNYSKLFEVFEFDKGQFLNSDRFLYEPSFLKSLRRLTNDTFSPEFMLFFCDIMKAHNKMISFSNFKKKIASNLKNFRDNFKMTLNGGLVATFGK